MIQIKHRVPKRMDPNEVFDFYMVEGHWLFMQPDRMVDLLESIKDGLNVRKDYYNAIEQVVTTPPQVRREMQQMFLRRYRLDVMAMEN